MIPETLSAIEARVRQTGSLAEDNKAELLKLLAALRTEIGDLARTKSDEAHRIAAIARISTETATHDQTNPEFVKKSLPVSPRRQTPSSDVRETASPTR